MRGSAATGVRGQRSAGCSRATAEQTRIAWRQLLVEIAASVPQIS
jgi:hypothetical protein